MDVQNGMFYMKKAFISLLLFLFSACFPDNVDYFSVSAGCFDFMRPRHRTAEVRFEYKPSFNLQTLRPLFGAMVTFKGASYYYGGISLDLFFNEYLYFSPSIAAGVYLKGKGKDLGFPIEFRSGAEFGIRFKNKYRLSATLCHLSNASLGNKNPGCESLFLTLYYPFSINFKKCK